MAHVHPHLLSWQYLISTSVYSITSVQNITVSTTTIQTVGFMRELCAVREVHGPCPSRIMLSNEYAITVFHSMMRA